jgi:uncharacterized protein (DUF433 family)
MRVGEARVILDSIVVAFQHGHSAETIQQQFPALTLEEIYGAITYYLANREAIDQYLQAQGELWRQWRQKAAQHESDVVKRLRQQAVTSKAGAR